MPSAQTIALVKATVPVLREHGEAITTHFYKTMFRDFPEVRAFFNQTHQASGSQPRALAGAVLAYAAHIDRLDEIAPALPAIIQKHVSLGITPEQYPIVGQCLLRAIREVLGEAATDDILAAWAEAYGELAELLIAAEEQVYAATAAQPGGWRGLRRFVVAARVHESSEIVSLHLKPEDGAALPDWKPGQYIALRLVIGGETLRRNYSVSNAPGTGEIRISVKREPGGVASGWLHEQATLGTVLELTPPAGEFVLEAGTRPLLFLTAGVGITPALAMLEAAAPTGRPIGFVHAARNPGAQAFRARLQALAAEHPNVTPRFRYSDADAHGPVAGADGLRANLAPEERGLIDAATLAGLLPANRDLDVYLLGPTPFMRAMLGLLDALDVPRSRVKLEFFGPKEALEPAAA
ncbi:NO-inducible flavohemoprotein [Derxia gummosa]|uniref:nitric oxide dioxygenase n=1 Tax=Derxia gummosa DSM 723 TaxID=1121388 RepID=A0A8B6X529_9BURK|nr:NO-inducible flavohemoprotein [Derxia gummosa]